MGMSTGGGGQQNANPMTDINTTPLVDVMLVLLIIFIITVPVLKHAVQVDLPRASSAREQSKPQTVRLSVDAQGAYWLDEIPVSDESLPAALRQHASREPQPDLHIRGDRKVPYERVAQAIRAGHYQADEALPSERMLSESLGLSRVTARKAIERLQQIWAHYVSEGMAREAASLFSTSPTASIEYAQQGVYLGRPRIEAFLKASGARTGVPAGANTSAPRCRVAGSSGVFGVLCCKRASA